MAQEHPGRSLITEAALNGREELLKEHEKDSFLDYYGLERSDEEHDRVTSWLRTCMGFVGEELSQQVMKLLEERIRYFEAIIAEEEAVERARELYEN